MQRCKRQNRRSSSGLSKHDASLIEEHSTHTKTQQETEQAQEEEEDDVEVQQGDRDTRLQRREITLADASEQQEQHREEERSTECKLQVHTWKTQSETIPADEQEDIRDAGEQHHPNVEHSEGSPRHEKCQQQKLQSSGEQQSRVEADERSELQQHSHQPENGQKPEDQQPCSV